MEWSVILTAAEHQDIRRFRPA